MEVYRFLVRGDGREETEVLETYHTQETLREKVVIRDESETLFRLFPSRSAFWKWHQTVPEERRCFHEVIFGWAPQLIKFDIDGSLGKVDQLPEVELETWHTRELDEFLSGLLGPFEDEPPGGPAPSSPAARQDATRPATREMRDAKISAALQTILDTILDQLEIVYGQLDDVAPTRRDIVVAESSGPAPEGWKYSYHLVVTPYALANNEEAKEFTARVAEALPPELRELVDSGVNSRTQNFRILGSHKPAAPEWRRPKRVEAKTAEALQTGLPNDPDEILITASPGARILTEVCYDAPPEPQTPAPAEIEKVLEFARLRGVLEGQTFRAIRGRLLLFRRDRPSHCPICNRVHDRASSLMLALEPAGGELWGPGPEAGGPGAEAGENLVRVLQICGRAPKGSRSRSLGTLALELPPEPRLRPTRPKLESEATAGFLASCIGPIQAGKVNPHRSSATAFEGLPSDRQNIYAEERMRDYERVPTLGVKGPMGVGKTRKLREYLDRHYPPGPRGGQVRPPVIRWVSFRQTFSKSVHEQFPEFALYNEHKGALDQIRYPRLIVQPESLHRLPMPSAPEGPDLLILDEVESILGQFSSGLHKHFNASFAMFEWLLSHSQHVICMDANLGDRTLRTLERMRPGAPPFFHWNRQARATEDTFLFTTGRETWLAGLYEALHAKKRVVVPTNSLTEADTLYEMLTRAFPDRAVRLYSSRTPPSEKVRHFADVHSHWKVDVLIYTPTVSAGVSFEIEHFDVLFGYFTDRSCDVETCRQMLARVRKLREREYTIFLGGTRNYLPTAVEDIQRLIRDKRTGLYREIDESSLHFHYDAQGEIRFYESPYYHLWLENLRVENLSRNRFVQRFIEQVADTGAGVQVLPAGSAADERGSLRALAEAHHEAHAEVDRARAEGVAGARDLTEEEFEAIRARVGSGEDVGGGDLLACDKYRLRDFYGWHQRPVSPAFVSDYDRPAAKKVYANLRRLAAARTITQSLAGIQSQEREHYSFVMEHRAEAQDLRRAGAHYVAYAHILAVWLLRLCGFRCITDKALVRLETMHRRLLAARLLILGALEKITFEFGTRAKLSVSAADPPKDYVRKTLGVVNPVLRKMYGIDLRPAPDRASYRIRQTTVGRLFVFRGPDQGPHPTLPHVLSRLDPVGDPGSDRAIHFVESTYYDEDDPGPPGPAAEYPGPVPPVPPPRRGPAAPAPPEAEALPEFLDRVYNLMD